MDIVFDFCHQWFSNIEASLKQTHAMNSVVTKLLERPGPPVAVLGDGVSGKAAQNLLCRLGLTSVLYDERPSDGRIDSFDQEKAQRHSFVIFSPGFRRDHRWLQMARPAGCQCFSELDFASMFFRGEVVAITGTNGKTTSTEFLAEAFRKIGRQAYAVGNNGCPLSTLAGKENSDNQLAVCEVSSFQAETLRHLSCHALLWTNFQEDHLDRHATMEAYFTAKWNLVHRLAHKDSRFVAGESVLAAARRYGLPLPTNAFIVSENEVSIWPMPAQSAFAAAPQASNLGLIRQFWKLSGHPENVLKNCAESFPARRHRLSRVCEIDGVSLWNDSKATNFAAAQAALESFSGPVHWIGGGWNGGGKLTAFARHMAEKARAAYLIGDTAQTIAREFSRACSPARVCRNLKEAVAEAIRAAQPGEAILFSPGFSSFDMFENYAHRGKCFEKTVLGLKKIHPDY